MNYAICARMTDSSMPRMVEDALLVVCLPNDQVGRVPRLFPAPGNGSPDPPRESSLCRRCSGSQRNRSFVLIAISDPIQTVFGNPQNF